MNGAGLRVLKSGALLALIAVIGVALLSGVHELTRETIAAQEKRAELKKLSMVLPFEAYDNDIHADLISLSEPGFFGHPEPVQVYRARKNGEPVAVIMRMVAPDGYNGDIRLLVGIYRDGTLSGVMVVAHRETPGLGDPIDHRRSDWIHGFRGRSLSDPPPAGWAVRKDGGVFDQFTGATITPRAVVEAVQRVLDYHAANRDELYRHPDES